MPKVSVIIPVYNVEKYLRQCLDSVINQTFNDIEIICINDGSTDGSLAILEEYAQKDSRIKVINQENQGVSVARNRGMKDAISEYLMFVDSDDWLEKTCIENTISKISNINADILCFGFNEIKNNITKPRWDSEYLKLFEQMENLTLNEIKYFLDNACGKLYKKHFLESNNINFVSGLKTAEDGIFNLLCLYKKPKYILLSDIYYNYRMDRKDSATNKLVSAVSNDIRAFKFIIMHSEFKQANTDLKIETLNKIFKGFRYYFGKTNNCYLKLLYSLQISSFEYFLRKNVDKNIIYNCEYVKDLKNYKLFKNILRLIFSKKCYEFNNKNILLLTILGVNFKIKYNKKFYQFQIRRYGDDRGYLTTIDNNEIPFDIKRVYYLSEVSKDKERAHHAHKFSQRVLSAIQGKVKVSLFDGKNKKEFILDNPNNAIYFNNKVWCELSNFENNTIVLALASEKYDENEYIRNYDEYLKYIGENK